LVSALSLLGLQRGEWGLCVSDVICDHPRSCVFIRGMHTLYLLNRNASTMCICSSRSLDKIACVRYLFLEHARLGSPCRLERLVWSSLGSVICGTPRRKSFGRADVEDKHPRSDR
jgi:hypothetical protein